MTEGSEQIASLLHTEILKRIIERIMIRLKRGESFVLTATDKWALETLRQAGLLMADIQKEIADRTPLLLAEVARAFEDACVQALEWDNAVYRAAGLDPTPLRQSPYLMRLAQRNYEKTCGELRNFTRTLVDSAQQTFIRECDKAYQLTASGALGYTQAVVQAVEAVAEEGVVVAYPSGHQDTIETATLRAVRTGIGQACDAITDARMDEMDWDIVLASAHLGARTGDGNENYTNHYWWQGKFYSRSGKDKRFPPWSDVGEGDVQGFGGPNCRHSKGPGDGVHNPFEHFDSEANREREKLDQRQRLLERRIRKTRREVMTLQEAIDKAPDEVTRLELQEAYRKKAAKLMDQEAEYDAFCKENDLRKLYDRLEVARYGPKQATTAEQVAEEDYQVWSKELNFNDSVKTLANYYDVKYTDSPRFELLQRYVSSVQSGRLSPLSGFGLYENYYDRIQSEIVGQTVGGVRITGQSQHFLERFFGCMRDPKTKMPRSGVELDDIVDCVLRPVECKPIIEGYDGNRSFVVVGKRAKVSVNPDTGVLIQVNPWRV